MTQYEVPERNMAWLREKVEALNKKAAKLGVEPIQLKVVGERIQWFVVKQGNMREYLVRVGGEPDPSTGARSVGLKFLMIEVTGEAPVLAGWRFIGTIQHVHDNGESVTILRAVPGFDLSEYRGAESEWCDHCQTKRFRIDTFVVASVETGERRRVGRQCLKDFIGHPKPEMYADWAESLGLLHDLIEAASHEPGEPGAREARFLRTEDYMTVVAAAIRQYGWVSGKIAKEAEARGEFLDRTRDVATAYFLGGLEEGKVVSPVKADGERAMEAIKWARDENGLLRLVKEQPSNDYLYNLSQVAKLDALNYRMLGIAASLITAYEREMSKGAVQTSTSMHFGEPGVRLTTILTVKQKRLVTLRSGEMVTLYKFETPEGDLAVWFTNNGDMLLGRTYRVKATVKRHDEYQGLKQTVLGRIHIMEEL